MGGRDVSEKLGNSHMIHIRKTIGRNHVFSEVGTNPTIRTCFHFMVRLREIMSKQN